MTGRAGQRGSSTAEFIIVMSAVIFATFAVVQACLWWNSTTIAVASAQEGARAAAAEGATNGDGIDAATRFATQAGAHNPTITASRTTTQVTITVTWAGPAIIDLGPQLQISRSATLPIERVTR